MIEKESRTFASNRRGYYDQTAIRRRLEVANVRSAKGGVAGVVDGKAHVRKFLCETLEERMRPRRSTLTSTKGKSSSPTSETHSDPRSSTETAMLLASSLPAVPTTGT
jgi:hypothetical protein